MDKVYAWNSGVSSKEKYSLSLQHTLRKKLILAPTWEPQTVGVLGISSRVAAWSRAWRLRLLLAASGSAVSPGLGFSCAQAWAVTLCLGNVSLPPPCLYLSKLPYLHSLVGCFARVWRTVRHKPIVCLFFWGGGYLPSYTKLLYGCIVYSGSRFDTECNLRLTWVCHATG
jgi:hypothetical protein